MGHIKTVTMPLMLVQFSSICLLLLSESYYNICLMLVQVICSCVTKNDVSLGILYVTCNTHWVHYRLQHSVEQPPSHLDSQPVQENDVLEHWYCLVKAYSTESKMVITTLNWSKCSDFCEDDICDKKKLHELTMNFLCLTYMSCV